MAANEGVTMSIIEIKHRWTGAVLWSGEAESVKDGVTKAVAAGAYLAGAYLARADLARADLAGANLAGANLAGANLARADLAGANLADADLAGANLADAYLAGANLAGAYLAGANLADANLADANLAGAYLAGAKNFVLGAHVDPVEPYVRRVAVTRAERAARYRADHPKIPFVEDLDKKILAAIEAGGSLEMGSWHSCDTTHCRAGWAIHLAGKAGYELEQRLEDPEKAGRAIYLASAGYAPHFYASTESAMADLKRRAAEVEVASPHV
jgi:hypothetical protein